ncbi:MAG: S8 family peptidase [Bdellovibrionota bacterium]
MKVSIVIATWAVLILPSLAIAQSKRWILEGSDLARIEKELPARGGTKVRDLGHSRGLVVNLSSGAVSELKRKHADLVATEDIELSINDGASAETLARASGAATTQPAQRIPWGLTRINARVANAVTKGAGVKVCVVDTGVDKTHPDLQGNVVGGRNYVIAKGKIDPAGYNDDNGHGSHVAGTIAALDNAIGTVGVAPEAKLYVVKALNARGSGYLSDIAEAVLQCVSVGSHVINMSLGADQDPNLDTPLRRAVESASAAGVVVVVAAGNEGASIAMKVPAGFPSTIAVAATDSSDRFASWSNYGLNAGDFSAPGVSIYSTWKSAGYNTISGTSMASPHMAGVVALKIASKSLGFKAFDLGRPLSTQGDGLIDALATVQYQP